MSLAKEFKEFAMRGNVIDMAVGIIIGAAFGKIVSTFVANVVTPPLGLLIGGVNFSELQLVLRKAEAGGTDVTLNYGLFLQSVFDFVIVAFAIFSVIKAMNSLKKKEIEASPEPAAPPRTEVLLEEIRDLLKK